LLAIACRPRVGGHSFGIGQAASAAWPRLVVGRENTWQHSLWCDHLMGAAQALRRHGNFAGTVVTHAHDLER
jgi:hypothetical protein